MLLQGISWWSIYVTKLPTPISAQGSLKINQSFHILMNKCDNLFDNKMQSLAVLLWIFFTLFAASRKYFWFSKDSYQWFPTISHKNIWTWEMPKAFLSHQEAKTKYATRVFSFIIFLKLNDQLSHNFHRFVSVHVYIFWDDMLSG